METSMSLIDLKDNIVRRIARSLLLRFLDGKKTIISRILNGIAMVFAGLFMAVGAIDEETGTGLANWLQGVNVYWVMFLQFLAQLGLEFGLSDRDAKDRGK